MISSCVSQLAAKKYGSFASAHCRAAMILITLVLFISKVDAQGTIVGQVSMTERAGVVTKDLATAVVYLEATGATPRDRNGDGSSRSEIAMRGREFLPHVRIVALGGVVAFPNQDPYSHNVFSNTALSSFDLGLYRRSASREAQFSRAGVYPIYCNIHARMVSFVIAAPTRHVVNVDQNGRFELRGVSAGTYKLHVWHERAPEAVQDISVPPTGLSVQVALDTRGYVNTPHTNKFGQPYAATRADRY